MATNHSENSEKIQPKFKCLSCDYVCYKKQHFEQHTHTKKHKMNIGNNVENSVNNTDKHLCVCGKKYKDRTGLWKHKQNCDVLTQANTQLVITETKDLENNTDLITYLMNENKELKNMIMDVCKNNSSTNISNSNNNNNVNSHNKTFNMNVFLNEHCKDAMNISEFVDSIQLGFNDLVNVGKVGYVEGISSIIINKLRSLDIHKRPMHCGDEKRHSMYIKEDGKWEKQPEDNNRVRRLIKQVAFKNTKNTVLFKEKYPDCGTSASKYSDQYNKIVMESFGGRGASDEEKENKIVRMIAKEVYIDKSL
jgi:hypothetical protein